MAVFERARVVAGRSGLDNTVNWVHIVDIPDAHYEWQREGVLLLTAGFGLRDDPERQAGLIPKLAEQGFAGMVFSTGYYFDHTPEVMREGAEALGFPVIETPREVLFIDLTEAILEQIVNRQYALLQQSTRIHKQLTEVVLQGGDLESLASALAKILERSITIEDAAFRVLAAHQEGEVDPARERSVRLNRTPDELATALLESGIYDHLAEGMAPLRVPPLPALGMTMERFVAPIMVDREIHGYIWIIAGQRPLTELDELAIGHGATVAALILFKEKSVREAEESLRGDFFEQLLRGPDDSASFSEKARRLNFHLDQPHQILFVQGQGSARGADPYLSEAVQEWFRAGRGPFLVIGREEGVVVLIESRETTTGEKCARELTASLNQPGRHILVGVGGVFEIGPGNTGAQRSYEQAREAARVGMALGGKQGALSFDQLGLLHWLYHLPSDLAEDNLYLEHILGLAAHDRERHTDLVKTLEAYLDRGGAHKETAQDLYIHRNTLSHRLERIETLCSVSLRDPLTRLQLHAALKMYRLRR
jgi:purine catabolism regulator